MAKILVADDEPKILEVMKDILEDVGYEVVAVGDGETIKQSDPLVLLRSVDPGHLEIAGPSRVSYVIEARSALTNDEDWMPVTTVTPETVPYRWVDPERSQHASRIYRVGLLR